MLLPHKLTCYQLAENGSHITKLEQGVVGKYVTDFGNRDYR